MSEHSKRASYTNGNSNRPWQDLGVDLLTQGGTWYLLIVEYYSKFPIIHLLPSLASNDVISTVNSSISVFGIPDEKINDNGSQQWQRNTMTLQPDIDSSSQQATYPRGYGIIEGQV